MEIEILNPEGVHDVEKEALVKIEASLPTHWRGYASLEMLDRRYGSSELDLVVVSEFQVIVVELKRIRGTLTSDGRFWYKNGRRLYKNPVAVTNLKAKKLRTKIQNRIGHKLPYFPFINYCVVLYGTAKRDGLTEDEKDFVIMLDDFLTIGTQGRYGKFFPLKNHEKNLSSDQRPTSCLKLWNGFFGKNRQEFVGREFGVQNYVVTGSALFEHPDKIYREYLSQRADDKNYKALLRRWDFSAPAIASHCRTADERALIGYRESKVLGYIDSHEESFEDLHLSLIYVPDPSELTSEFVELYQWPKNRDRIEEFIRKNDGKLNVQQRLDLLQVFVSQLARLHGIKVAHRDLGTHSVWISLPSRVTFSNFVTASYPDPDKKTMYNVRPMLQVGQADLPEDLYSDSDGTQFTRDVYLAGACAHLIAYGEWPHKDEDNVYMWEELVSDPYGGKLNCWFEKALDMAAANRFSNMDVALDALNAALGGLQANRGNVSTVNEAYLSDTNIWTKYQCNTLGGKGACMLLKTADNKFGIKLWNGIAQDINGEPNHHLSIFLQRVQSISSSALTCFPRIVEFGLNATLMNLFIVYEWIEGETLSEWDFSGVDKSSGLEFMRKLLVEIRGIHQNRFFHGDIHPDNLVVIDSDSPKPKFIDIFEFKDDDNAPYNRNYLPDNFEGLSIEARDRFAVTKIVKELAERLDVLEVARYAGELLEQVDIGDGDIDRFISDFELIANPPPPVQKEIFEVTIERVPSEFEEFVSDDGTYFITVRPGGESQDGVFFLRIFLSGVKHQIDLHVDPESRSVRRAWFKEISHSQFIKSKRNADFEIEGQIRVKRGHANQAESLLEVLFRHQFIKEFIVQNRPDLGKQYRQTLGLSKGRKLDIRKLWRVLVETEQESLPKVTVQKEPELLPNGDVVVVFSADGHSPDFDLRNDKVILKKSVFGKLKTIGRVVELGREAFRLARGASVNQLRAGDEVALESVRSSASLAKRQKAMEALLAGRSLITNLPDYFDTDNRVTPIRGVSPPTNEELGDYDESDSEGKTTFSLNSQQRLAFQRLVENGPISLLQGPPGTGKTAFISSFIHYVVTSGANRILLVSQSHEAVNNATEKVRTIFERRDQSVAIVRLGNEEHASEALRDVHELSLQEHYREKFRAEFKIRLKESSKLIGLPSSFVDVAIEFEKSFGSSIESLKRALDSKDAPANVHEQVQRLEVDLRHFFDLKLAKVDSSGWGITNAKEVFYEGLANSTGVSSPKLIAKFRMLADLASEWLTVMSSGSANFQNFLAKTRTLVCGTCVGIGRTHYGIDENTYDWVVIDEAARASSSELAIAMRVGHRVLLVGDHKQLGALYDEEHIKAAKRIMGSLSELEVVQSDFERAFISAYGAQVGQTLTTQYRMAPAIGTMVSQSFYGGLLQNGRGGPVRWVSDLPSSLGATITWVDTSDKGHEAYEHRDLQKDASHSKHNTYEIKLLSSLLQVITSSDSFLNQFGDDPSDDSPIGVICMYKEQKHELIRYLNSAAWSRELIEKRHIKIDTVDSYQGKENSIVIVSLVRNNSYLGIGYLAEGESSALQRSNVAISRAKERLYLVGASRMFSEKNKNSPIGRILGYIKTNLGPDICVMPSGRIGGN